MILSDNHYSSDRSFKEKLFCNIKKLSNYHKPSDRCNIFIFSSPRSGSEWLTNIIAYQRGIKYCSELFNLRKRNSCWYLDINNWKDFYINENKIKIIEKLKSQINGDFSSGYMNPSPFNKYYNFFTDRIVFKIHFAGEDTVNVFQDELNGRIIYLLRHPIPVSLSRKVLPKLKTYIESNFRRNLSDYEIKYAEKLIDEGNYFKCAILDWCIQNKVIMQQIKKNWIVVTYEQLVLDPLPIIDKLMIDLLLENKDRMIKILSMPSKTVYRKDRKIKHQIMKNKIYSNKIYLLEKWKGEINDDKEKELMNILNHFEIDCYKYGDVFPAKKYWVS